MDEHYQNRFPSANPPHSLSTMSERSVFILLLVRFFFYVSTLDFTFFYAFSLNFTFFSGLESTSCFFAHGMVSFRICVFFFFPVIIDLLSVFLTVVVQASFVCTFWLLSPVISWRLKERQWHHDTVVGMIMTTEHEVREHQNIFERTHTLDKRLRWQEVYCEQYRLLSLLQ